MIAAAATMLAAGPAAADVEIEPLVVIDFSDFEANGFSATPGAGELDSNNWSVRGLSAEVLFGEEGTDSLLTGDVSEGGVDDPGIWAFDVDGGGNIALGVQPTMNEWNPGSFVLRLVNNTGGDIDSLQVEYTVWVYNDTGRSNSFNFFHSADDGDGTIDPGDANAPYTQETDVDLLSPTDADANPAFVPTDQEVVITPANPIADGANYYLAWRGMDEVDGDTTRDEFGVNMITIRMLNVCGNGLVEDEEECDDANADNTDECIDTCAMAACGDGFVQTDVEECDDGNMEDGDGCAADCTMEAVGTGTGTGTGGTGTGGETGVDTGAATTTTSTSTTATTMTTADTSGVDTGTGGGDDGALDDDADCACRSSRPADPLWSALGLLVLGLLRRRR